MNPIIPYLQTEYQAVSSTEEILKSIFDSLASKIDCCGTNLDISKQIPHWILVEKEDKGGNELTVFDFIQKYYDWLYCDYDCDSGSGYLLENKFLEVIDIEKTKEKYLKRLYSTYFPEYKQSEQLKNKFGSDVTSASLGSFVKHIKTKFYVKKGSIEALKIFFEKIFLLPQTELSVKYPKKQLLRLNGGAFSDLRFSFNATTSDRLLEPENVTNEIIGSKLNYSRFQDGEVFTDYSYILTTGISQENYKNLHLRTNHPAGTNCIFELEINLYQPPGSTFVQNQLCEIPLLKQYSPYKLNNTYTSPGLTYTNGCTLSGSFGGTPSYSFPNWAEGMTDYDNFFNIPIEKMFRLCRINNNATNPNSQIPISCP